MFGKVPGGSGWQMFQVVPCVPLGDISLNPGGGEGAVMGGAGRIEEVYWRKWRV
jgi:hypothetical protein